MKFPGNCTSDRDRAEFCEKLKTKLIKDHGKAKSIVDRRDIEQKTILAGFWASHYRKQVGIDLSVEDDFKDKARKSVWDVENVQLDIEEEKRLSRMV